MKEMIDIIDPQEQVEILIRQDGKVLWVNVDGVCRLRICQINEGVLTIVDDREILVEDNE